ncbi:2-dehydro-3-deoxy-D-gluconate 5-dehydrogenase KduD [Acidaminobacter sp. JC074]|uniref:2-dehydro-3-deoxy-D-gluconate 5-dehydrogenase KduD n=1 Tax=Acidaminobacter sp. JC074 TaxID=2530199 RepID=UPI001F0F3B93|nr:2-dehydro-3-deoxy-D-gluconate 5-dehydrogenase KduD [Acidaminobacter sp. JC074]MCH4886181.1 2-dehydro-3-deoxy-D-gluconate 5-dehydrogenase KduD [Acidaminobacter sp. JC074]
MILNNFDLTGKVAMVTGACTGLGQGMAVGLAEAGADIVAVDIGNLDDTKEAVEKLGRRFLGLEANLMALDAIDQVMTAAVESYGKVDILINNAGIIRREDAINFSEKDWDDVMNLNVKSVFFMSQKMAKQCMANKISGKIINIASMLSFQGGIRVPSYTASKSGVMGITRLMANEWAKEGINVNAIAPGYMDTNNTAQLRADKKRSEEILGRIPASRWGLPEDLKGPVVFLASKASDYVNGYTLAVDGGWLAR